MSGEPERIVSGGKNGKQVRKAREDGWTARKREIFLDHYAATGNAAEGCRAAGMAEGAAYRLRRRDAEFAEQYEAVHAMSKTRLEELCMLYAQSGGRMTPVEPGEIPPVDLSRFDPELALQILRHARPSTGHGRRVGARPRSASKAELIEAITKLLVVLDRRARRAR